MDFTGFVGDAYTAPSLTQDAQACENWYCEIDPAKQGRGVIALYPTPGLRSYPWPYLSPDAGNTGEQNPVRGLFTLPGSARLLMVVGARLLLIDAAAGFVQATAGAPLMTGSGPVAITSNGLFAMITDGVNRYSYNIAANTVAILVDGAWPGGVRCDITDNYIVYNQPGTKQWAATSALSTATPALSFASTLSSFDNLVSLIVDQRQVALLGEQTMEFWSDVGSFPFPFSIIPGTTRQFGCAAPYSVTRFGDGFAFLAKDQLGQGIVLYCAHYQVERISTHAIENDLVGQVISDAFAFTYQITGHVFYVLQFPTADRTWVFDLASKMWHKRTSMDADGTLHRWRANCVASYLGNILVGDNSGKVFALDQNYALDDGPAIGPSTSAAARPIRRMRRAPHLVRELKRQFFKSLQIQFQPGPGTPTGQGEDPQAMLRYSDDGGFTWSDVITAPVGRIGEYKNRAMWRRLGMARDRVFEVSMTDPVYQPIISANLEFSEGAN